MIGRLISILVIVLVVGLVLWLARVSRLASRRRQREQPPKIEPMVACAHCGMHVPRREACWSGETPYCNDSHRHAGPRPSA